MGINSSRRGGVHGARRSQNAEDYRGRRGERSWRCAVGEFARATIIWECLIIQLHNRQRLRVNGRGHFEDGKLTLHVEESYVNCPKYITRREFEVSGAAGGAAGKRAACRAASWGKRKSRCLRRRTFYFWRRGIPNAGRTLRIAAGIQVSLKSWMALRCAFLIIPGTACSIRWEICWWTRTSGC